MLIAKRDHCTQTDLGKQLLILPEKLGTYSNQPNNFSTAHSVFLLVIESFESLYLLPPLN